MRQQRMEWHVAHARVCGCRAIPDSIKSDAEKLLKALKRHRAIPKGGCRFLCKIALET